MPLTPEEEKTLEFLKQKQALTEGNVLSVLPGSRIDRSDLEHVREFTRRIETGEIDQFVLVGIRSGDAGKFDISYSHSKPSLSIVGALYVALVWSARQILP